MPAYHANVRKDLVAFTIACRRSLFIVWVADPVLSSAGSSVMVDEAFLMFVDALKCLQ